MPSCSSGDVDSQCPLRGTVTSRQTFGLFVYRIMHYSESADRGKEDFHHGSSSALSAAVCSVGDRSPQSGDLKKKKRKQVVALNVDIIGDEFWRKHPEILT